QLHAAIDPSKISKDSKYQIEDVPGGGSVLRERRTGRQLAIWQHSGFEFATQNNIIVKRGGYGEPFEVWDIAGRQIARSLPLRGHFQYHMTEDGKRIITTDQSPYVGGSKAITIQLWNSEYGLSLGTVPIIVSDSASQPVTLSPD